LHFYPSSQTFYWNRSAFCPTGFIISKLAPAKPTLHAIILGLIGTAITIMATTNATFANKAPLWYGYTLAAITIPCLWLGVNIQLSFRSARGLLQKTPG
jgi:hypothetical protein